MEERVEKLMHILAEESKSREQAEEINTNLPELPSDALRIEYLRSMIDRLKEENNGLRQDREQRKIFGYIIFGFMCIYMAASLVLVFLCGFCSLRLSDNVIIVLLTTSLANVIGIFNFVAKYLFHPRH